MGPGFGVILKAPQVIFNVQPMLRTAGLDHKFFVFVYPQDLDQWSSNLSVRQDHLESLSKHSLLILLSEFLIQQV